MERMSKLQKCLLVALCIPPLAMLVLYLICRPDPSTTETPSIASAELSLEDRAEIARFTASQGCPCALRDWIDRGIEATISNIERCIARIEQILDAIRPEPSESHQTDVVAVMDTPTDLWVGTSNDGLFRYDRKARRWESFEAIYEIINRIWREESRIYVDHGTTEGSGRYYTDFSDDRGQTWTRFLFGDDSGEYVHTAEFTNLGCRSERLERITEALRKGDQSEELIHSVQADWEIYFSIYVNSDEGCLRMYRYDLIEDRLTDLTISDLDIEATGVRIFYLDPYQTDRIWILTGRCYGPFQLPGRWLQYDRTTRIFEDVHIKYDFLLEYAGTDSAAEEKLSELIRFEPDRVEFLISDDNDSLVSVATYDRKTKLCSAIPTAQP